MAFVRIDFSELLSISSLCDSTDGIHPYGDIKTSLELC
jgi:hypothetical protein